MNNSDNNGEAHMSISTTNTLYLVETTTGVLCVAINNIEEYPIYYRDGYEKENPKILINTMRRFLENPDISSWENNELDNFDEYVENRVGIMRNVIAPIKNDFLWMNFDIMTHNTKRMLLGYK